MFAEKIKNPSVKAGEIIENRLVARNHHILTIRLPSSFATPDPGQFVMIRDMKRIDPLLSRPFSVFAFERKNDFALLSLLFRIAGRGTKMISELNNGFTLGVFGPLGRGFKVEPHIGNVILVGGGVGVAPLVYFINRSIRAGFTPQNKKIKAYIGAGTSGFLDGLDAFFPKAFSLRTSTDDGSRGYHGQVTELLKYDLVSYDAKDTVILACGPRGMIRSLQLLIRDSAIRCHVSLEERMACGIGACLGCVVAVKAGDGESCYQRVCHDGPVFDIRDIDWEITENQ